MSCTQIIEPCMAATMRKLALCDGFVQCVQADSSYKQEICVHGCCSINSMIENCPTTSPKKCDNLQLIDKKCSSFHLVFGEFGY